jgi:uncharacterized protein (DUF983 family)
MHPGFIGGIIGCGIGLAGGILGTYCSIKNTNGPRERAFMIKASAVFWIVGIIFISLLLVLQSPYKWFLWLPYSIFLPISIHFANRRLTQIKQDEAQDL